MRRMVIRRASARLASLRARTLSLELWAYRHRAALAAGALLAGAVVLAASDALARPGGGQSFGGGSRSGGSSGGSRSGGGSSVGSGSSSGGGGDGGDALIGFLIELLFRLLIELVIHYPKVGIPVLLVLVLIIATLGSDRGSRARLLLKVALGLVLLGATAAVFTFSVPLGFVLALLLVGYLYVAVQDSKKEGWATEPHRHDDQPAIEPSRPPAQAPPPASPRAALERVQAFDPDFSLVLFEDFLYRLYTEIHRARGAGALDRMAPYLDAAVRARLAARAVREVRDVVIGALRLLSVEGLEEGAAQLRVRVEFEANYTEVNREGQERGFYVLERLSLVRSRKARSRPPERASVLGCPACGAPLETEVGGACRYCKTVVESPAFDWRVEQFTVAERKGRAPVLTANVEEQGTDLPTITAPNASRHVARLAERDPAFSMETLRRRIGLIFGELQAGWSSGDLARARPFVSDHLYQSLSYWIDAYRKAKLRNVIGQPQLGEIELAAVSSDRWYDAITVRVHAQSLDYTADEAGKVVSGSDSTPRRYTEYWTLIRGASRQGPPGDTLACPSCGAPLQINMAGHCTHCQAKVTTGEFDWVLSRIEQDEAYTG